MTQIEKILVTGGAGYIGSHACIALVEAGFEPLILDNFSNSDKKVISRIGKILGRAVPYIEGNIKDQNLLDDIFSKERISAVMHFAGLKSVSESIKNPLHYYDNNISGTVNLLQMMARNQIKNFIFSSSATVYGIPESCPIGESAPLSTTNPYGRSKLIIENILLDLFQSDKNWNIINLRYFNPIGAHKSGLIGEAPQGTPNNIAPYITQVAVGKLDKVHIFGSDYPTKDGTGVRDYIHVMDLVEGHVAALHYLNNIGGHISINLGTGTGVSVLELIAEFSAASGKLIPYEITARRPGDVAECWANPRLALEKLGWSAKRTLADMCQDAWRWQQGNTEGY